MTVVSRVFDPSAAIKLPLQFVYIGGMCVSPNGERLGWKIAKMFRKVIFWILVGPVFAGYGVQRADAVERNVLNASRSGGGRVLCAEPVEIHNGFVIFEGRYVPPPYVVQSEGSRLYVNGLEMPQMNSAQYFRRQSGVQRLSQRRPSQVARVERQLDQDAMLICMQAGAGGFVPAHQAVSILDILISDGTSDAKVRRLLQTGPSWIGSAQWAALIETFSAPPELSERLLMLKQRLSGPGAGDADFNTWWDSRAFVSGMTITGFILAVLALGMLLNCRPPMLRGWRTTDSSPTSGHQVILLVALIVVLNIYDLICTVFANGAGGLWEINPFAGDLIQHGPSIVAFKLSLTIGAAVLLLVTRCHRLAQIGSYWFGVLYTVLILRWITFNSILL